VYKKILELQSQGQNSVLVTIINAKGSTPRDIGAKMLVTDQEFFGTIGGGGLEWVALEQAREILKSQKHSKMAVPLCSKAQQCCGGFVELFFEVIQPKPQLLIFGAGHVSQAFLEVIAGTSFDCTLIDERTEWIESAKNKGHRLESLNLVTENKNPLEWIESYQNWSAENTYVIVLTHDHSLDEAIIEKIALKPTRYLGLIGSQTKRERFFKRLQEKGLALRDLERISCPMGLPLGGKVPKEVATSIAAEVLQIYHRPFVSPRPDNGIVLSIL